MKTILTCAVLLCISLILNSQPIKVQSTGNVEFNPGNTQGKLVIDKWGLYGYSPRLYPTRNYESFLGESNKAFNTIYSYSFHNPSDKRQKENFRHIDSPLDIVLKLNGTKYDYKKEIYSDYSSLNDAAMVKFNEQRKDRLGLLAQDVKEILPEAVHYDIETDVYTIDYLSIIPVLIEAMKEQQKQIEDLKKFSLDNGTELKSAKVSQETISDVTLSEEALLFQNNPNPFTGNTEINYFLPESVLKAMICIYDMNGKQLKCFNLQNTGHGSVSVDGNELDAGMYMYTLIADEKVKDTKRMILTN